MESSKEAGKVSLMGIYNFIQKDCKCSFLHGSKNIPYIQKNGVQVKPHQIAREGKYMKRKNLLFQAKHECTRFVLHFKQEIGYHVTIVSSKSTPWQRNKHYEPRKTSPCKKCDPNEKKDKCDMQVIKEDQRLIT